MPGGFRLPMSVAVESCQCRAGSESSAYDGEALAEFARQYLCSQMLSGTILNKSEEITEEDACLVLTGRYECLEMIGRERGEEIVHGKND